MKLRGYLGRIKKEKDHKGFWMEQGTDAAREEARSSTRNEEGSVNLP